MLDERYLSQLPSDRSRLVRVAQRLLGATAEAEDAVQESYLRALEAGAAGRPAADVTQAWLTTVLQNLAIDQMRRRDWMRRWLQDAEVRESNPHAPSAEDQAALAEASDRALRVLAATLDAADGAAVLLREVFEASYADIADASGKTEAGCRQQVHRALMRLRRRAGQEPAAERDQATQATLHIYLHSLRTRDMQPLLGLLRQPATRAVAASVGILAQAAAPRAPKVRCEVAQVGGKLGLVLRLGSRFVCVLPLGAQSEFDPQAKEQSATVCG